MGRGKAQGGGDVCGEGGGIYFPSKSEVLQSSLSLVKSHLQPVPGASANLGPKHGDFCTSPLLLFQAASEAQHALRGMLVSA